MNLRGYSGSNYLDIVNWSVLAAGLHHANAVQDSDSLTHSAKNSVFPIEPLCWSQSKKKLTPISVWTCISHGQDTSASKFKLRMQFIFKMLAKYTSTPSTCSCWVSALHHEVLNDSVKFGIIIVASSRQFSEVLASIWGMIPIQLQCECPHRRLQCHGGWLP